MGDSALCPVGGLLCRGCDVALSPTWRRRAVLLADQAFLCSTRHGGCLFLKRGALLCDEADDVLDAEAVEHLNDLERVEAPDVQPGTLVLFRARRATETAARSLATRVP